METVRVFNSLYDEFILKLMDLLPDNRPTKKYYTIFSVLRKTNPRATLEFFMKGVMPYVLQIMSMDESFFLSCSTLKHHLALVSDTGIHTLWGVLGDSSKQAIWQYMRGLTKLAFKYYGIKSKDIETVVTGYDSETTNFKTYLSDWKSLNTKK